MEKGLPISFEEKDQQPLENRRKIACHLVSVLEKRQARRRGRKSADAILSALGSKL